MADTTEIKFYFAYTSPFAYLAMEPAYALERSHNVHLRFIPYGVNIRKVYGDTTMRSHRDDLKVRYLYLDARRFARERGLTIYPPKKIYSARFAFYAGMCAEDQGLLRPFADRVFERFWKHELDVESVEALSAIMTEVGASTDKFLTYIGDENAEAKPRLKQCFAEADRDMVFGVPTFVIDNERFWGHDRIEWLIKKLDAMNLRR
jgi:2-hydroxychromene-2-carboxylate isomerase